MAVDSEDALPEDGKTEAATKAARTWRDPGERLEEVETEIARVREREEKRLIQAADKAGYFGVRLGKDQIIDMFHGAIKTLKPKRSALAALESRKARVAGDKRKNDARRKALLGGFLVAQCRHKPELHAAITADIRAFLKDHPSETVADRNMTLLEGFLADPAAHGTGPGQDSEETLAAQGDHRDRAHRLILLGAWVLERHATRADLALLIAEELERFLNHSPQADRNKDLLRDVLP